MIDIPVRVKDALRDGNMLKNYRFNVLNDDGTVDFTIDNNVLVSESVKFDERMATGNKLKFGLCEGSSLEFQYFNHPNITGRQIQAFIDVQFIDENNEIDWYTIPMGFFTVDQCPMQFSTGIKKVMAYNKLRSTYLDQKCNDTIIELATVGDAGRTGVTSIGSILQSALEDYAVEPNYKTDSKSSFGFATTRCMRAGEYGLSFPLYRKEQDGTYTQLEDNLWFVSAHFGFDTNDLPKDHIYIRHRAKCHQLYEEAKRMYENSQVYGLYVYDAYSRYHDYIDVFDFFINYSKPSSIEVTLVNDPILTFGGWMRRDTYFLQNIDMNRYVSVADHINDEYATNEYVYVFEYYDEGSSKYYGNEFYFPVGFIRDSRQYSYDDNAVMSDHQSEWQSNFDYIKNLMLTTDIVTIERRMDNEADQITFNQSQAEALSDVTLRELQSAVFETVCQYGQLDRITDLFKGVELNNSRLLPADNLYPNDSLYPNGNSLRGNKSMYSKLWTDSQGVQTFRYLIITYKGTEEVDGQIQEVEKTLQRTVNTNGTTDYNMSDNWLFKNLIWTDEEVGEYADVMVLKMRDIKWFPFEMWCAGLPYLETGDEIEITSLDGTYTSYVLQRQLTGIQNLQDTYINGELDIF